MKREHATVEVPFMSDAEMLDELDASAREREFPHAYHAESAGAFDELAWGEDDEKTLPGVCAKCLQRHGIREACVAVPNGEIE